MNIKVGDMVNCKHAVEANYSSYGGKPKMVFKPGMVGVVVAIAPKVTKHQKPDNIIHDNKDDFLVVGYTAPETKQSERVALNFCNVRPIDEGYNPQAVLEVIDNALNDTEVVLDELTDTTMLLDFPAFKAKVRITVEESD